jgi:hypothetical protein
MLKQITCSIMFIVAKSESRVCLVFRHLLKSLYHNTVLNFVVFYFFMDVQMYIN